MDGHYTRCLPIIRHVIGKGQKGVWRRQYELSWKLSKQTFFFFFFLQIYEIQVISCLGGKIWKNSIPAYCVFVCQCLLFEHLTQRLSPSKKNREVNNGVINNGLTSTRATCTETPPLPQASTPAHPQGHAGLPVSVAPPGLSAISHISPT